MAELTIQHAAIQSVNVKSNEKLGAIVEVKLHCRLTLQTEDLLPQLSKCVGLGPEFIVGLNKHQLELGETNPALADQR